jgi:Protein of unknown function (DUF3105)
MRPGRFLAAVIALTAAAALAAAAFARLGDVGARGAADSPTGCDVRRAAYGYPDWYLSRQLVPTVHPPDLAAGWRGQAERVEFDTLFHAIFHGYLVVQYRADIAPGKLAVLRTWVRRNAGRKVTSAPAPRDFPFALHAGKWGHELRCARSATLTTARLDAFLALPRPAV